MSRPLIRSGQGSKTTIGISQSANRLMKQSACRERGRQHRRVEQMHKSLEMVQKPSKLLAKRPTIIALKMITSQPHEQLRQFLHATVSEFVDRRHTLSRHAEHSFGTFRSVRQCRFQSSISVKFSSTCRMVC